MAAASVERGEVAVPFSGQCRGAPIGHAQRQGYSECHDREQEQDDKDDTDPQTHVSCPAENRSRAPCAAANRQAWP